MPINWQDQDVKDRLLAAIIASFDGNINCREIARLYGGEATYNAIENFLRKPKAKAKQLKAEAEGRAGPVASPARPRGGRASKAGKGDGVKTGRVGKSKAAGKKGSGIKKEVVEDEDEGVTAGDASVGGSGDGASEEDGEVEGDVGVEI